MKFALCLTLCLTPALGCETPTGRPGFLQAPHASFQHGRLTVDEYRPDPGFGTGGRFEVVKLNGDPLYMDGASMQNMEFCELSAIEAVGVTVHHPDPEIDGTWVMQVDPHGSPRWTRICEEQGSGLYHWEGALFRAFSCEGVAYDATTLSVIQLDPQASPPTEAPLAPAAMTEP